MNRMRLFLSIYQKALGMFRFMRLIVMFDLPTETKVDLKNYRIFVKNLTNEGYIRLQYSIYSKLCINKDSAMTASKKLTKFAPPKGDIRYMVITEQQYQNIVNLNETYSLQEKITTVDRTVMIGGMNDDN